MYNKVPSLNFNYDILYYRPSIEFQNTLFYILCSEEEVMSLSVLFLPLYLCLSPLLLQFQPMFMSFVARHMYIMKLVSCMSLFQGHVAC